MYLVEASATRCIDERDGQSHVAYADRERLEHVPSEPGSVSRNPVGFPGSDTGK
jgi:hypothetical protein